jgi:TRAP transporter 4TM/12TM fusion protein
MSNTEIADKVLRGDKRTTLLLDVLYALLLAGIIAIILVPVGQTLRRRAVWIGIALIVTFVKTAGETPFIDRYTEPRSISRRLVAGVLVLLSMIPIGYLIVNYLELAERLSGITQVEVYLGLLLVGLVIEGTRRTMGSSGSVLAGLALVSVLYMVYGHYLPGSLGHAPISLDRTIERLYLGTSGIFSFILGTIIQYVIPFVVFGKILEVLGATNFLMAVSKTITSRMTSGPAKLAVVASALMGTISGTVVGNIATTGAITIPTMKESGVDSDYAAAIESAASTGGQIMPPVMGIAIFIMVTIIGVPYLEIVTRSLAPALLYFFVVFLYIHLLGLRPDQAVIADVKQSPDTDLRSLLKQSYYVIPLIVLLALLVEGVPIALTAIYASVTMLILGLVREESRLTFQKARRIVHESMELSVSLLMIVASIGIVVGVTGSTGLGLKFSTLIISLSMGITILVLVLTMIASIILGMGMSSTVVAYIILATLIAPALTQIGYEPIVAHLFVFYFGMFALITPPVGVGIYTAAGMADADGMRAGIKAMKICLPGFLLPYLFVLNDGLLLFGSLSHIVSALVLSVVILVLITVAQVGYYKRQLSLPLRGGLIVIAGGAAALMGVL